MATERYISLKPSEATHGGGMVPEGEYEISDAKFINWDYNGSVQVAVPALGVEYKTDEDIKYAQYYSAGDAKNLEPADEGKRLRSKGTATALNDSTNCFAFMKSLVNSGFSEDKIADDISILVGCRVKVVHEAAPEREIGGRKIEKKMIAVIGKVLSVPGEKTKKAATAAKKTSGNGSESAMTGERLTKAAGIIIGVLKEHGGQLDKKAMSTAIFRKMPATDPDRGDILNLLIDDGFLKDLGSNGVLYDAKSGTVHYVGD